jgi:hypothetical protein
MNLILKTMRNTNRLIRQLLTLLLLTNITAASTQGQSPAKETILLKEDFDSQPVIAVPQYNYGDTAFATTKDGHYVLDAKNSSRFWALRLQTPDALPARPTILEMKMKVAADSPRAQYGILWHTTRTAPRIFNEYVFMISTDGKFTVYSKINDQPYALKPWKPCDCVNKGSGVYNTLRIEEGDKGHYRFFINEQLAYEDDLLIPTFTTFGFYSDAHTILSIDYIKFAGQLKQ